MTDVAPGQTPHCARSQRSARHLSWFEGVAFKYFLTTKSLTINQISLSENAPKLTYEHQQIHIFPRGDTRALTKEDGAGDGDREGGRAVESGERREEEE